MKMPVSNIERALGRWSGLVNRRARIIVLASLVLALAGGYYAAGHLVMQTSTEEMLSPDLPFRKLHQEFNTAFPVQDGNVAILVTGVTADQAEDAALALAGALSSRSDLFEWVYYPEGSTFFRRNGLLFLSTTELAAFSDRVAAAEPFLGKLASDMSLRGLFGVLGLAATGITEHGQSPGDLGHVMTTIGDTVESVANGGVRPLSWRALMSPNPLKPEDYHQVILAQVRTASTDGPAALAAIPQIAAGVGIGPAHGTRVELTGDLPIGADEAQAVTQGGEHAGLISLALVSIIAFVGLRSLRLVAALIATLVISLVWTSAFAALAIGHLNLLSASFAVLFIGVAMDFSVQFGLRFQEARNGGRDVGAALREATSRTGSAIALAAFSAAVGFFSFVPTAYRGLAELGIISGVGMLIGLLATMVLLPAFLTLMPVPARPRPAVEPVSAKRRDHFIVRHARAIGAAALLLGLLSLTALPRAGFEVDPIKLENPASQSVRAYNELMADSRASPYTISVVAPNLDAADALAKKLGAQPLVGDVVTLSSFVPEDQENKLAIIDQMSLFLLPVFEPVTVPPAPTLAQNRSALAALVADLGQLAASPKAGDLAAPAKRLVTLLEDFAKAADDSAQQFQALDHALLGNLRGRLTSLRDALGASKVTLADLPAEIKVRYITADGRAHIEISPKRRIAGTRQLRRFVDGVRTIAPAATGTAVLLLEGADAVVGAFKRSGALAFIGVSLLLILALRSIVDWLLVAIPLALALSFTITTIVLLDTKLNLANIMALPLLFTLGSAFGVYLVMRSREIPRIGQLFHTSTPRAVLVSALTTMASFGSLMVSSHRGMASMGELLAISLSMALATNLIVLPALLAWRESRRGALAAAR
jgi:hopanoid biosynthesis associated RND transporter like protein HpnN